MKGGEIIMVIKDIDRNSQSTGDQCSQCADCPCPDGDCA